MGGREAQQQQQQRASSERSRAAGDAAIPVPGIVPPRKQQTHRPEATNVAATGEN